MAAADLRAYFGLSQPELATWLGMSRALLASVETGREQLPARARPWLRPWVLLLPAEDDPPPADVPPRAAAPGATAGPAVLLARLHECHYQAERLRQQLADLHRRTRVRQRRLAASPRLWAALPPAADAPAHAPAALCRRWLARLLEAAADSEVPESGTGPSARALLLARHGAWRYEADWLEACLAGRALGPVGPAIRPLEK